MNANSLTSYLVKDSLRENIEEWLSVIYFFRKSETYFWAEVDWQRDIY